MKEEEKTEGLLEQVKDSVSTVSQKISDVKDNLFNDEMISEFREMGTDAATKVISQLTESREIIKKAGYELKTISVDIGLPPAINTKFLYTKNISEAEREALLNEAKDKRMVTVILKGLFKADDLYNSVKLGNYKLVSVQIAIGLIPDVIINLETN